jgi:cell division protein FtsL
MEMPVKDPRRGKSTALVDGIVKTSDRVRGIRSNRAPKTGEVRLATRFLLITLLVCLGSIVWLSQTSTLVSLGYGIAGMEKQRAQLNIDAQRLQSQIAQYESIKRIEDEAKNKLGMVPAKNSVYVKIPAIQPESTPAASTNPYLAPDTEWWKDLRGILPQQTKSVTTTPGTK